jgi:hypothetical protein
VSLIFGLLVWGAVFGALGGLVTNSKGRGLGRDYLDNGAIYPSSANHRAAPASVHVTTKVRR